MTDFGTSDPPRSDAAPATRPHRGDGVDRWTARAAFGAVALIGLVLAFVVQWFAWIVLDRAGVSLLVIAAVSLGALSGMVAALQRIGRRTVGRSPAAAVVAFIVPHAPFLWFAISVAQLGSSLSD